MSLFNKILVANRGEIAIRIIRTIHEMGGRAVSVYSEPDASSLHVRQSDEAYHIGPGPASESYLNIEAIISAAQQSRAEAIHPGYGFLSENADFAQAVEDAGITFIGPPSSVIRLMGNKIEAKRLVAGNGVPLVPGYSGEDQSPETLQREAQWIGYPVMVKAAAGGGGRGMREVERSEDLPDAIEGARREALAAFGDEKLLLEKRLVGPRHIEVQVLGDKHGNIIHLFERDCSVQRRHQKVLEEAPSPALDDDQRRQICAAGVRAAKAAKYVNAGTVEFLWTEDDFYFLEMNTRIQVEHGVTELVTGTDLVRAQIEIAAGRKLPWTQEDIGIDGHAIEARLYAENASAGFLPQFGSLHEVRLPERAVNRRIDTAIESFGEISRFYDPMIAKVMSHGTTRPKALQTLRSELRECSIKGVQTNLDFLLWATSAEDFVTGRASTAFSDQWRDRTVPAGDAVIEDRWLLGAVAFDLSETRRPTPEILGDEVWYNPPGWRIGGQSMALAYRISGRIYRVRANRLSGPNWQLTIDGDRVYDAVKITSSGDEVTALTDHKVHTFRVSSVSGHHGIILSDRRLGGQTVEIVRAPLIERSATRSLIALPVSRRSNQIISPMPGTIAKVNVLVGESVLARQPLLVLEAMKMEHVLEAPHEGIVKAIPHNVGDLVNAATVLVELETV